MGDDRFAEPPTEFEGHDRGTHRGWGCVAILLINGIAWTILALMVKAWLS